MKRLSNIDESVWADIHRRSNGIQSRKEDEGKNIVIDGQKYILSKEFWDLGDEYNLENSEEWICFAFNKPTDNSKMIRGNGEDTGTFGYDKWDIGDDEYDVYVLRKYLDSSAEELTDKSIDEFGLDYTPDFVRSILRKYVYEVYTSHMSDYAYFWIYELDRSDMSNDMVIGFYDGTDLSELESVREEFEGKTILEANTYLIPMLEGWYEHLEIELTDAYEDEGWALSKTCELDPYGGYPNNTICLCFVKLGDKNDDNKDTKNNDLPF